VLRNYAQHGSFSDGFISRDENRRQVNIRDMKMTWTILMVCLCYFIFVMPISVLNMADPNADNADLHLVSPA
jgi:uncharacterized integral membrane protein